MREKAADGFVQSLAGDEGLIWNVLYGERVQPFAARLGQYFAEDIQENPSISEKMQKISALNQKNQR